MELRRQQDKLLRELLEAQAQILKELNSFRIQHAELHGRLDQQVQAHGQDISNMRSVINEHEKWINTSKGFVIAVSMFFGTLGAAIFHFLFEKH